MVQESSKRRSKPLQAQPEPQKYAWVQLYEARLARLQTESISRGLPRGRPPKAFPTKRVSLRMTSGDEDTLLAWQEILKPYFDTAPSLGESVAIVAKILLERYQQMHCESIQFADFSALVSFLVGETEKKRITGTKK